MTECCEYKRICGDQYEAKIQLDPYNSRARLLEYQGDSEKIIEVMKRICQEHAFGKLICAVRRQDAGVFLDNHFLLEGKISGFFRGETASWFSYFWNRERAKSDFLSKEDEILSFCEKVEQQGDLPEDEKQLRTARKEDAEEISRLFEEVFPFYPTPMNQPEYVRKMMDEDVLFKVIEKSGAIVSVASADMDPKFLNAEITDCATREAFRGNGYLNKLVFSLERDLRERGYITAFSLSRARSFGINIVLRKRGYEYSGRHINNCRIMNGFEDMNIWVKKLQD